MVRSPLVRSTRIPPGLIAHRPHSPPCVSWSPLSFLLRIYDVPLIRRLSFGKPLPGQLNPATEGVGGTPGKASAPALSNTRIISDAGDWKEERGQVTDQISRCSATSVRTHRGDRIGAVREGGYRAGRPPLPPPWCRSRHSPLGSSPASPMASLGSFPGIWEGPAAAADEAERSCCRGGGSCLLVHLLISAQSQPTCNARAGMGAAWAG